VAMRIEAVAELTPEIENALARLLPQLNPKLTVPDHMRLERLVADPDVVLLLAWDGDDIVGTTTVIVYTTPFWIKARLDEVVVDERVRGKGVGEALVKAALDVGRDRDAQIAELQSGRGSNREAAHRLYERLGFRIRDSDVFRIVLE
jgi:GNAT superfamily N-acetyltransferase